MANNTFKPEEYLDLVTVRLSRDASLVKNGHFITSPIDAVNLVGDWIKSFDRECVACVYMRSSGEIAGAHLVSMGTIDQSYMEPGEVIKCGLLCGAKSFVLLHNHPSGNVTPSDMDTMVTDRMLRAGQIVGLVMEDHIIVGNGNPAYFSFRDKTTMIDEYNERYTRDYHQLDWGNSSKVAEPSQEQPMVISPPVGRRHR